MSDLIRREDAIKALGECPLNWTDTAEEIQEVRDWEYHKACIEAVDEVDAVSVVRKPIKGYEGYYEVDQLGRVFSVDRVIRVNDNGREYDKPIKGGQLKQHMHSKGYKIVCLTKNGKSKNVYVHRLVAEAFVENPSGLPLINHIDEDKTNNFADNLEWCTNEYNVNYGKGKERRANKIRGRALTEEHKQKISDSLHDVVADGQFKPSRKIICLNTETVYPSISVASKELGINAATLWSACKRGTTTRSGMKFMFYDDFCSYGERSDNGKDIQSTDE